MLAPVYWSTGRRSPEDGNLNIDHFENLKAYYKESPALDPNCIQFKSNSPLENFQCWDSD